MAVSRFPGLGSSPGSPASGWWRLVSVTDDLRPQNCAPPRTSADTSSMTTSLSGDSRLQPKHYRMLYATHVFNYVFHLDLKTARECSCSRKHYSRDYGWCEENLKKKKHPPAQLWFSLGLTVALMMRLYYFRRTARSPRAKTIQRFNPSGSSVVRRLRLPHGQNNGATCPTPSPNSLAHLNSNTHLLPVLQLITECT